MGGKMDTEIKIPEEIVEVKDINFYTILTKKESDKLDRILEMNERLFRVQKKAVSSLIKLIIENTYLYINNNEIDIDEDIQKILTKKYYRDIDPDFKKTIAENQKARDFIVELVRTRLLEKYKDVPIDDETELVKKQFRLSYDDVNTMSILMGTKALSSSEYITSLIRYFLNSNTKEILNYKSMYIIDKAIKNKEYIIVNNRKIKPICYICEPHGRYVFYVDEQRKRVETGSLRMLIPLTATETHQKYSLKPIEVKMAELRSQLKHVTITYDLVDGVDYDNISAMYLASNRRSFISPLLSKTTNENHVITKYRYSAHIIFRFKEYEEAGYIKNLKFSDNYSEYKRIVDEYEGIQK